MMYHIVIIKIMGALIIFAGSFGGNETAKAIVCCFGMFLILSDHLAAIFKGKAE